MQLGRAGHVAYCLYEGGCNYHSIPIDGAHSADAAGSYERLYTAVADIKAHVAFYPDRTGMFEEGD